MKPQIIPAGQGLNYDWSKDHLYIKAAMELTDGRVTVVEDTLKPGFDLPRHHHKKMTEIFYLLEGEVAFAFDGEPTVIATRGVTINIPPTVWHHVSSPKGATLLTIFSPGGFDHYLAEMAKLSPAQFADEPFMAALSEKYDQWLR